ncbi:MAG TPA: SRPBCC family protein [Lysobacter sp.]
MTRLIEILISLAIVAVLFVVVGVLLPSSRHLSNSVETNRKSTIVFDTLNGVRRFKDWNPAVAGDPNIELKLSGPEAGVGARIDWNSKEPALGKGSWEITKSEPGQSVAYAITDQERGRNKRSEFTLKPTGRGGRNVEITQTYDVEYGWNLLGRYAGMYVSSNTGEKMKAGLARLTNILAAVPNFDYSVLGKDDPSKAPRISERPAENLLVLNAAVERNDLVIQNQMKTNIEWIKKNIAANGLEAVGPVRIITNEIGSEIYSFDVAQEVRKPGTTGKLTGITLSNNVELLYNEPTKIAVVPFTGHMSNLPQTRDALRGWAMTRGYETTERAYEIWRGGIDAGFTDQQGQYDVIWAVK